LSILSDTDLLELHRTTGQPLSPFLTELHKPETGGPSYGLSSAGYDVRLSHLFAGFYQHGPHSVPIDPTIPADLAHLDEMVWRRSDDPKITLYPGAFILAATEEIFAMPDDCIGRVTDKSTWARLGVCVQNTVIEPGWSGQLVLEITNHNVVPIVLTVGVGIAQVVFERLESRPTTTYRDRAGKYQDQRGITLPR
jgi:dCTP deaminase